MPVSVHGKRPVLLSRYKILNIEMKMFHISLKLVCGLGIVRSEESIHNSVCLLSLLPQAVSESGAGRVTCTMFQVTGTPAEQVQIADLHVIQGYISGT